MAGLNAILQCEQMALMTFRTRIDEIAYQLYQMQILPEKSYIDAADFQSNVRLQDRAYSLFVALKEAVSRDEKHYVTFLDFLKENPSYYKELVSKLSAHYQL